MLKAISGFTKTIWLVVLASFASRFIFFMIWPFLAVLLHDRFGLDPLQVGLFLSAAALPGIFFGFFVGILSDRIGRRRIIVAGLLVYIVAMVLLGAAGSTATLFAGAVLQALARGMVEPPGRALMTDTVADRDIKDMALHVRYFALNVGAATGPLLGAWIGVSGRQSTFFILSVVYAGYLLAAAVIFRIEPPLKRTAMAAKTSFAGILSVLGRDRALLLFVIAALLGNLAYAQIDSTMVQYLRLADTPSLTRTIATLIFVNGTTIVLFQFPMLKLTSGLSPNLRASLGVGLVSLGLLGFAIAPVHILSGLMAAMFVLSMGELILFPTINIIIDSIAPDDLKGSYVGAAQLASLGFILAPVTGGSLLQWFGGAAMWSVMAALALFVAVLFRHGARAQTRQTAA